MGDSPFVWIVQEQEDSKHPPFGEDEYFAHFLKEVYMHIRPTEKFRIGLGTSDPWPDPDPSHTERENDDE